MNKRRKPGDTEIMVVKKIDDFINKIQNENRSLDKHIIYTWLQHISKWELADTTIEKSSILYRARLLKLDDTKCNSFPFEGFDAKNSMQPPREKTFAMRANYERIPYLYCNTKPYGAMSEIRPYIDAKISLAEIKTLENLKCLNLSYSTDKSCADDSAFTEKCVSFLVHISSLFKKPVEYGENEYDYYPTQRIAEFIKNLGYDGIMYNSAMFPLSKNLCIFNYGKCEAVSSRIYTTTGLTYDFIQNDKSHHEEELDNRGKVAQLASAIYKSICGDQLPNNISTIEKLEKVLIKITGDKNYH